ncbi:putative Late nodulin [Medicago truncatula]|uniref:Nodule Cysteine-Rich (NCR) secreted peptide n=1 Tax=Medicago truncatula TaxID=3880 RepID=G7KA66_MEDTR|nr:Nodule Cysteine-Rich (NCR) secreted peptide [Medicago truncatula]RHN56084.1 putative Late nodulin [Medicago truncatula]
MDEILKFVFCMIIFLSLFLIATKVGGEHNECETDADCPKHTTIFFVMKCIDHICRCMKTSI